MELASFTDGQCTIKLSNTDDALQMIGVMSAMMLLINNGPTHLGEEQTGLIVDTRTYIAVIGAVTKTETLGNLHDLGPGVFVQRMQSARDMIAAMIEGLAAHVDSNSANATR